LDRLIGFLLDHAVLDFTGELTMDSIREFLRDDDSAQGRALLAKLADDGAIDEMLVTLADCLQDYIRSGIKEDTVREQLQLYSES